MDSVEEWEWDGENKKYFCSEKIEQWFQKILIIKRIESELFFYVGDVIKLIAYLFMS